MLNIDDISIADIVTVHSAKPVECPCGCGHVVRGEPSFKGVPLCVMGIELPYLATRPVLPGGRLVIVDVREVELMRCGDGYWKVFAGGAG